MGFAANAWDLVKDTVTGFVDDNALSRGASIAYYTLFSIAPVLLIIVAIAADLRPRGGPRRHRRPFERADGRFDGQGPGGDGQER